MNLVELYEQSDFRGVIKEWQKEQYQISTDHEYGFVVAASHFRLGNLNEACSFCEELDNVLSNNENFLAMYAAILRRMMLLQRAEEIFQRALALAPTAKDVRNNYSNLLIDLGRNEEAKKILEKLVNEFPDYTDAGINLQRVNELIEKEGEGLNGIDNELDKTTAKNAFGDPLDNAFEVTEVTLCGSKVGSLTAAIENLLPNPEKSDFEEADKELIELTSKLIKQNQFNGALEILEKLRKRRGTHTSLYQKACEANIGLENYRDAEVHGLIAHIQGDRSISNVLNLASLSAMRKDQLMASYWLMEARKIDESDELYIQSKNLLFPENKAREEDRPFQINKK